MQLEQHLADMCILHDGGHFRDAYGLSPGDWVLVRPDSYVGAIVAADELAALERYLGEVGVTATTAFSTAPRFLRWG
jgi:hypothetical protein